MDNRDLQDRINQDKPRRLEKYGIVPEDVNQDLIIQQQQPLRGELDDVANALFKVKVTDFLHLKSLVGVPEKVIQAHRSANHTDQADPSDEIQVLAESLAHDDHTHEEAGRLTLQFLSRSHGADDEKFAQLLASSKVASQVVGAELNVLAYDTIELKENEEWVIPNEVNIVTADKLIMHSGSKITVHDLIKFDIHYFEVH